MRNNIKGMLHKEGWDISFLSCNTTKPMQPLSADTQDSDSVELGELSRVPTDTQHTVLGTQPRRETRQTTLNKTGPTSKKSPKGRSDPFTPSPCTCRLGVGEQCHVVSFN